MRKIGIIAALAAFVAGTTAAQANAFNGPYIEVNAGYDDVTGQKDTKDVVYGAATGYNFTAGNVVIGPEVTVDNVFDRADVGGNIRLGYAIGDKVLPYVKVGYANFRDVNRRSLDGVRVGGGLELNLFKPIYTKVEYRYSDFQQGVGKHSVITGLGVRF